MILRDRRSRLFPLALCGLCFAACAIAFSQTGRLRWVDIAGSDWHVTFRPAARHLADPYQPRPGSYPPWLFALLWPLAILPGDAGFGIVVAMDILVLACYVRAPWRAILLILTWPVMLALVYGHVDPLLVLVFMLPPGWGLLAASIKPHLVGVFAIRRALGRGWASFIPLVIIFVVSLLLWGWWPARFSLSNLAWAECIELGWPRWVPLGVLLMLIPRGWAWLAAGLLLSPYVLPYHLTPLLAYVYRRGHPVLLISISILSWAVIL